MLKAALFDLDGTLIDTEHQYTKIWEDLGRQFRPDIENLAHIIKGNTLKQIFELYFPSMQDRIDAERILDERESQMSFDFYPGALDFIRDLKSHGVICAIITASSSKKISALLKYNPSVFDLFDFVLCADDFTHSKPHPECYLKGAERAGASPDECVIFEDAEAGLRAGMNAGIYTIALANTLPEEKLQTLSNHILPTWEGFNYQSLIKLLK